MNINKKARKTKMAYAIKKNMFTFFHEFNQNKNAIKSPVSVPIASLKHSKGNLSTTNLVRLIVLDSPKCLFNGQWSAHYNSGIE